MVRAYFSIGDAEALLPALCPLVQRAQALKQRLDQYERVLLRRRVMTDGTVEFSGIGETYDADHTTLKEAFYSIVEQIENSGGILRDVEEGIIDFYSRFESRDVFLCWRVGERKVRFWREIDDDVAGRKRIIEIK